MHMTSAHLGMFVKEPVNFLYVLLAFSDLLLKLLFIFQNVTKKIDGSLHLFVFAVFWIGADDIKGVIIPIVNILILHIIVKIEVLGMNMFKTCNLFILIILYTLEVLEIKSKPEMFVCNMQIDIQRLQDLNDSWIMNAILQIPQINSYLLTQVVVNFFLYLNKSADLTFKIQSEGFFVN